MNQNKDISQLLNCRIQFLTLICQLVTAIESLNKNKTEHFSKINRKNLKNQEFVEIKPRFKKD